MKQAIKIFLSQVRVALLAGAVVVAGSTLVFSRMAVGKETAKGERPPVHLAINDKPVARDGKLTSSFAPVVKKVAPSVVNVYVSTKARHVSQSNSPQTEDEFFRRFFGDN